MMIRKHTCQGLFIAALVLSAFFIPAVGKAARPYQVPAIGPSREAILSLSDDSQPTLSVNDVIKVEGNSGVSAMNFTVSLSAASSNTVTVTVATSAGTAIAGTDYVSVVSTELVFNPGDTFKNVAVNIIGDTEDELDETLYLNLSNPENASLSDSTGVGTIDDDDGPTLSINDVTVTEGNSGSTNAIFTVQLSATSVQTITVDYTTSNGTATAGADYIAQSGSLSFSPGQTSKTISVAVLGDLLDEPNETYTVNLTNLVDATFSDNSGLGTITDDDPTPTLSINDNSITEGDSGTAPLVFTVTLSAPSGQIVSVNYATQNDSATAPSDFTAKSGTLTFTPGVTQQTISISIVGDLRNEQYAETFKVNLSSATNATISDSQGIGTIYDNDPLPVLSIANASITEGNSGTKNLNFTVNLTPASGRVVTVDYATANGSAIAGSDFTTKTGTVSFSVGATSRQITIVILGDVLDEFDETFTVILSDATNAEIGNDTGIGTILDDDNPPTASVTNVSVTEGDAGTVGAVFWVNLSAASGKPISVNYASADNTAVAPQDYSNLTGTLNFAVGVTTQSVTVDVVGDVLDEFNETFHLVLSNPVNVSLSANPGVATIIDDDVEPGLTIEDTRVTEGDVGTTNAIFTVTLSSVSGRTVAVDYITSDDSALAGRDYLGQDSTLYIPAGALTYTLTVPVLGDLIDEPGETFTVTLSNPSYIVLADDRARGEILDDDPEPDISISDVSLYEGNTGTTSAVFSVTLSLPSGKVVGVDYQTIDGSALAGSDYVAQSGGLSFPVGTDVLTITVPVIGETLDEADETFTVRLSNPVNANILDGDGVGVILNDDGLVELSIDDIMVTEGDSGSLNAIFTVTLSASSGKTVTVSYATADDTAIAGSDFTPQSGMLTFDSGTLTQNVIVPILGDLIDEPDETFTVTLSSPTNAFILDGDGRCLILDNDAPPSLSIDDASVVEGDSGLTNASFGVHLSLASEKSIQVSYGVTNGSAMAGSDYQGISGTITIEPGQASSLINIPVIGDVLDEPDETFTVYLTDPINVAISDGNAVGEIQDDDPPPSLSINDVSVKEGNSGVSIATFTASLSQVSGKTVTVNYDVDNDTAMAGSDYIDTNGVLTFNPGVLTRTINVEVIGDTVDEFNEVFNVTLSNPTNATILDAIGVGTIEDDDGVGVSISDVTVVEGNSGTVNAVFTVSLSEASLQTVSMNYATQDGTATTADNDYAAQSGTLTFNPGVLLRTIVIPVYGDTKLELHENFMVNLSNPVNATFIDATGVGTIRDDDHVWITINDVSIAEGHSGTVNAVFTINLSKPSAQMITLDFATTDGTAEEGLDYIAQSGIITFDSGITSRSISIEIIGDLLDEPDETFTVTLSNPINALLDDAEGVGTIRNDDKKVFLPLIHKPAVNGARLPAIPKNVMGSSAIAPYISLFGMGGWFEQPPLVE